MIYVEVKPEHAEHYSRGIMRLLRPSHLREENWTDLYCSIITHPTDGRACLVLPENETIPIHIEADGAELAAIMQVSVDDGAITQAEADAIKDAVQALAGQTAVVANFVPPSWQSKIYTEQQLRDGGWFPEEIA